MVQGCTKAFDRGHCIACNSDSVASEEGCTDGTPRDSPDLIGGMKINPAYVQYNESKLECFIV
jgi:hypothetical protein